MIRPFAFCISLFLFASTTVPAADEPRDKAVEKLAESAREAAGKLEWRTYAHLIHADSLKDFRGLFLPVVELAGKKDANKDVLESIFGKGADAAKILAWEPEELFVRFMNATASQEPMRSTFASTTSKVIGVVHEGPTQSHLVLRTSRKYGTVTFERMEVQTIKKQGEEWKLVLNEDMKAFAQSLKATMTGGVAEAATKAVAVPPNP